MPHDHAGLSRRQMLRRGVAVGTAVWTVPTVTAITLTSANAASPSGQPPTKPPKPPTTPPEQPTPPPSSETPTTPPERPPGTSTPNPPPGGTGTPSPKPPGSAPPHGDDDSTAGGGLPDTGPGDVAQKLAVGGLLTAAGAAVYVASRKESPEPGDAEPGVTT